MVSRRLYPKTAFFAVFGVVLLLGPLRSWGEGPQTVTRQPTEPIGTTTSKRAETRKAWIVVVGGGLGWAYLMVVEMPA